eukprot:c27886_g1_i1.p1 GENE.c27886_g1_i1~~c27886_g1_i1.p1  ORF type:complete len:370 (+),score=74.36 c27886_g1_i1:30-1139(+)
MLRRQHPSLRRLSTRLAVDPFEPIGVYPTKRVDLKENIHPLTDTFGRQHTYLRVSLTERCNLRCQYCMPEEGVPLSPPPSLLTTPELVQIARVFAQHGVKKIRLTGGEPLLRKDLIDVVQALSSIEGIETVGMTTNAVTLTRQLPDLVRAGLSKHALNISLDTLDPFMFEIIARRKGFDRVVSAIDSALELGFAPLKVNCVVVRGVNDDQLVKFAEWTRHKPVAVRFIEYMPFDGNTWGKNKFISYFEMVEVIKAKYPSLAQVAKHVDNTERQWQIEGHAGTLGFITSMSKHFCASCNRLRLTADGSLKVCLFGRTEVSLRDIIREGKGEAELLEVVRVAVRGKKAGHDGMFNIEKNKSSNRPMVTIGG